MRQQINGYFEGKEIICKCGRKWQDIEDVDTTTNNNIIVKFAICSTCQSKLVLDVIFLDEITK
jgi:hypothetical protein